MAKRKRNNKRKKVRRDRHAAKKRRGESVLAKDELHLNRHDEDKLLLFATGILFGLGVATAILGAFLYAGLAALIFALVIMLVEVRHEEK